MQRLGDLSWQRGIGCVLGHVEVTGSEPRKLYTAHEGVCVLAKGVGPLKGFVWDMKDKREGRV